MNVFTSSLHLSQELHMQQPNPGNLQLGHKQVLICLLLKQSWQYCIEQCSHLSEAKQSAPLQ